MVLDPGRLRTVPAGIDVEWILLIGRAPGRRNARPDHPQAYAANRAMSLEGPSLRLPPLKSEIAGPLDLACGLLSSGAREAVTAAGRG
jgi:hypothetical protein